MKSIVSITVQQYRYSMILIFFLPEDFVTIYVRTDVVGSNMISHTGRYIVEAREQSCPQPTHSSMLDARSLRPPMMPLCCLSFPPLWFSFLFRRRHYHRNEYSFYVQATNYHIYMQ